MNKTLLCTTLIAVIAAAAFAPTAQAAGGTITFNGKVLADTCTVAVNGGATVQLPTVMTSALSTANAVAGATNFNVGLTNCDTNTTSATMAFTAGTTIDTTTGNLKNTVSGGSTAQIQLLSGASVINTNTNANAPVIAITSGAGSTTLTAQYIAVGAAASAGLVQSTVAFTLTYL
jgi:major type 1 subunit fimbrin (pilin)